MKTFDVVTLGEALLRFTPPHFQRIEQSQQLNLEVAGSELNTAVGLARLGLKVTWLSRLPNSALGRCVVQNNYAHGVDASHVSWSDTDRMGLYFWEDAPPPRSNVVIYDRKDSATSRMTAADLPTELFQKEGAHHLHLTGITPALSAETAQMTQHAAKMAKDAGWTLSFDLNLRRKLWTPAQAQEVCTPLIELADLFITPIRDAKTVLKIEESATAEKTLTTLAGQFPNKVIALTLGADGAMGLDDNGRIQQQPIFPTTVVDRLGSGDAFAAGLLYGFYFSETKNDLSLALRWGNAMAAMKRTIKGDLPIVDKTAVEQLVNQNYTLQDSR